MYDLKNFNLVEKPIAKQEIAMTFNPKTATNKQARFIIGTAASRELLKSGHKHCKLMLSKDKILAVVASESGGRVIGGNATKSNPRLSSTTFTTATIVDLVSNMYDNQAVAFFGEYDEKQKALFFDLNKPTYL